MKRFLITTAKLVAVIALLAITWMTLGVLWPITAPVANQASPALLIKNISLVDTREGRVVDHQDILVESGRISAVGQSLSAPDARVIDASGQYAIPGLFDMHVHSLKMSPTLTHPLFIAAGVTAVRDMGGCIGIDEAWVACAEEKRQWNRAVNDSSMVGPRFDQITSLAINGGPELPDGVDPALGASSPAGAARRVLMDKNRGIDFLKPYTDIPREGYLALASEANSQGLYLAGHQPLSVSGMESIEAGQKSIEHALLFVWECYPGMAAIRSGDNPREVFKIETRRKMVAEHSSQLCEDLQKRMATQGTALVPTHTTRNLDAKAHDPVFRTDPRLVYIPTPLRKLWLDDADGMARKGGVTGPEIYNDIFELGLTETGLAHKAGVQILAGSDAPDSFVFPGTGLHDELDHLVNAGLSPLDALRAATLEPARFLNLEGEAGEIVAGSRADIVLLDANPLESIKAIRSTRAVILAGSVYDRDDLDELLQGTRDSANHWSMWPKFIWQILNSPIMLRQIAD